MFSQFIKTATANDSEKDREEIMLCFEKLKLKKNDYFVKEAKSATISVMLKAAFYNIPLKFLTKKKPPI